MLATKLVHVVTCVAMPRLTDVASCALQVVEYNDPAVQSVAAAVMNTCIMLNGAVFQPLVGALLAAADDGGGETAESGSGSGDSDVETYSARAYVRVMALYPATFALSCTCALWLSYHPPGRRQVPPVAPAPAAGSRDTDTCAAGPRTSTSKQRSSNASDLAPETLVVVTTSGSDAGAGQPGCDAREAGG